MTAPAPQDPAAQSEPTATAEIAALLAGLLAAGTAVAATAAARRALLATYEAGRILQVLAGLGIARDVATAVLTLTVTRSPLPATGRVAPASAPARRQVQLVNLQRRAAYLVTAARRVQTDVDTPTAPTPTPTPRLPDPAALVDPRRTLPDVGPPPDTVFEPERRRRARRDALEQERRHFDAHARAAQARNRVSRDVDELAAEHGDELRWRAKIDAKTSPYCAAANGRLFLASRVPPLGFPGTVHPSCRCVPEGPGPRRSTERWVYDVDPRLDAH